MTPATVLSTTTNVFSTFVVHYLIELGAEAYNSPTGLPSSDRARGIGAAVGLYLMTVFAQTCDHHFIGRAFVAGVAVRGCVVNCVFRRSLRLTGRARAKLPNSRMLTHISADAARLETATAFSTMSLLAPIQLVIICILLIVQLGAAALAGIGLMVGMVPVQTLIMRGIQRSRARAVKYTDARIKRTQEAIAHMQSIKFFCAWSPCEGRPS